ncbi:MAG: hypothetical protein GDA67_09350 [Nitrospira sp. CR1.3]|nr:hypothetical protein [Nitrospira sp. CR1.3]
MRRLGAKECLWLGLLLGVAVVLTEGLAKVLTAYGLGIREADYSHYYIDDKNFNSIIWVDQYQVHPYFGYENESIRRFEAGRGRPDPNDFVIGILGGSVAEMFGNYALSEPTALRALGGVIPESMGRNLRIVNLAMGGAKQPQQFFISTYFLEDLDLVINIDGWNDTLHHNLLPVYPLDFPMLSLELYSRATDGRVIGKLSRLARWTYTTMNRLPMKLPVLAHSNVYFLVWYAVHDRMFHIVRRLEGAYYVAAIEDQRPSDVPKPDWSVSLEDRLKIWKRYTSLQWDLLARAKKPAFFFVQPNQYLKNSKPLSVEERQAAYLEDWSRDMHIHEQMSRLKEAVKDLRHSGVPSFDLTGVFETTRETTYQDTCCHINRYGNKIMAEEIVRIISQQYAKETSKDIRQRGLSR